MAMAVYHNSQIGSYLKQDAGGDPKKDVFHPQPAIDGAITPDKIPMEVAYRLFFKSVARMDASGPALRRYLQLALKLGQGNLPPDAVERFGRTVKAIADEHERGLKVIAQNQTALTELRVDRTALTTASMNRLTSELDTAGAAALNRFVSSRVRSQIRRFDAK
jgi:hypothetical protein